MNRILTIIAIVLFTFGGALSEDWLTWRGVNGNGNFYEKNWNPQVLLTGVNVLWETNVGMGHSAVAVKGNLMYTMGNRQVTFGDNPEFEDIVYCFNVGTGAEVWRYTYPCAEGLDPGPGSSPVIDGSFLYTIGRDGQLYCFNAANGNIVWYQNIMADSLIQGNGWGFSGSPVIEGDLVIINANQSGVAFNKKNGECVWLSEKKRSGYATPLIFKHNNQRIGAVSNNGKLVGFDPMTGSELWSFNWEGRCADPIYSDEKLFLTGTGTAVYDIAGGKPKRIWRNSRIDASFQSWVVVDGYAYGLAMIKRVNNLICIDLENGEVKWGKDVGQNGSIIAVNDNIVLITGEGRLVIVQANPNKYEEISSASIVKNADNTGVNNRRQCHCWINPVIANGRVFLRNTYGDLFCVDMSLKPL